MHRKILQKPLPHVRYRRNVPEYSPLRIHRRQLAAMDVHQRFPRKRFIIISLDILCARSELLVGDNHDCANNDGVRKLSDVQKGRKITARKTELGIGKTFVFLDRIRPVLGLRVAMCDGGNHESILTWNVHPFSPRGTLPGRNRNMSMATRMKPQDTGFQGFGGYFKNFDQQKNITNPKTDLAKYCSILEQG